MTAVPEQLASRPIAQLAARESEGSALAAELGAAS